MICTAVLGPKCPNGKEYTVSHSPLHRIAVAAVAVGLVLTACGKSDSGSSNPPSAQPGVPNIKTVKAGKLTTCTSLEYPPFQFNEGGKVVGFDVDMIDLVAKKMGVEQSILDVKFDLIKSGASLNSGSCDVAAAGMTITDERKANLDFSNPYFPEILVLISKKGSGLKTVEDVKSKNLKLGVQTGTTSLDYAKAKGMSPTEYDDAGKQLLALQSGQVDAAFQDLPTVNSWLKKSEISSAFEKGDEITNGDQYGFAVKKGGNPELLKLINDTLTAAIKDGTWAKIYKQWIGSDPKQLPPVQ
jgi:polar amino acid transport system substrate-binding protein